MTTATKIRRVNITAPTEIYIGGELQFTLAPPVEAAPIVEAAAPVKAVMLEPDPVAEPVVEEPKADKPKQGGRKAKAEAPAAEPKADKPKSKGKGGNKKLPEEIIEDEWLGMCEYLCKGNWTMMAIIARPSKDKITVAYFFESTKGDTAGKLMVGRSSFHWNAPLENNAKLRNVVWK